MKASNDSNLNNSPHLPSTEKAESDEIIVVALDILTTDPQFLDYAKSTLSEKISRIEKAVQKAYDEASLKHPLAKKIILAWREHALFDGLDELSISKIDKDNLLKTKLLELTNKNPKLAIVAGGTLVRKTIQHEENIHIQAELKKIDDTYNDHNWIDVLESHTVEEKQLEKHRKIIHSLQEKTDLKQFTRTKNSAFIAFDNTIIAKDKAAPFEENINYSNRVFQPAKRGNKRDHSNPIITVPLASNDQDLKISVEICREISFALAKNYKKETNENIDIQFILSDWIGVLPFYAFTAQHAMIHIDSHRPACIVLPRFPAEVEKKISLYQYDILNSNSMVCPIQPIYPLQYQLLNYLDSIREDFIQQFGETETAILDELIRDIEKHHLLDNVNTKEYLISYLAEKESALSELSADQITKISAMINIANVLISIASEYILGEPTQDSNEQTEMKQPTEKNQQYSPSTELSLESLLTEELDFGTILKYDSQMSDTNQFNDLLSKQNLTQSAAQFFPKNRKRKIESHASENQTEQEISPPTKFNKKME